MSQSNPNMVVIRVTILTFIFWGGKIIQEGVDMQSEECSVAVSNESHKQGEIGWLLTV